MDVRMINPDAFGRFGYELAEWFTAAGPLLIGAMVSALLLTAVLSWVGARRDR